jgi:hypothetical protein
VVFGLASKPMIGPDAAICLTGRLVTLPGGSVIDCVKSIREVDTTIGQSGRSVIHAGALLWRPMRALLPPTEVFPTSARPCATPTHA